MSPRFVNTQQIKLGFWIGAGLFAFSLAIGLITHVVHK